MDETAVRGREAVVWEGYAAWSQFTWLYFVAVMVMGRAVILRKLNAPGWNTWLIGAMILLGCVAVLRRWGGYVVTTKRILLRNGWTGREIQTIELGQVSEVSIKQGPLAGLMGIGTVVIRSQTSDRAIHFRGVFDPEQVKAQIQTTVISRPI